jgi:prolyl-tRNA synthetase
LQNGTSHYFGDGFAKAFDISFSDKDNRRRAPFETSWGITTRTIGGLIMTHGDNRGLVLPPRVAPVQAVIIPVAQHKPGVLDAASALRDRLQAAGIRVKLDASDNSPGWKFAEYEMKGVPLRVEIGPKDIEKGQCVLARRDTGEKTFAPLSDIEQSAQSLLEEIHANLFAQAKRNLDGHTFDISTPEEAKAIVEGEGGFLRSKWCGSRECEEAMKERAGVSSRCIPFEQRGTEGTCPVCGKKCETDIYWGIAY